MVVVMRAPRGPAAPAFASIKRSSKGLSGHFYRPEYGQGECREIIPATTPARYFGV